MIKSAREYYKGGHRVMMGGVPVRVASLPAHEGGKACFAQSSRDMCAPRPPRGRKDFAAWEAAQLAKYRKADRYQPKAEPIVEARPEPIAKRLPSRPTKPAMVARRPSSVSKTFHSDPVSDKGGSMATINYYRVSTREQSIESQKAALGAADEEFRDEGVSGTIKAADRPGFADLLKFARRGDTIRVFALDRLGRDALDVEHTVHDLLAKGVAIDVKGLGLISSDAVGKLIVAVIAHVAAIERERIRERTEAGKAVARDHLARTGRTHKGKTSMGRPKAADPVEVKAWRIAHGASKQKTADHFNIGTATVARYCR